MVAKGGAWHLVCRVNGKMRVYRVSQLSDVEVSDETFRRPADFDLAASWKDYSVQYERDQSLCLVTLRADSEIVDILPVYLSPQAGSIATLAEEGGQATVEVRVGSPESARSLLLALGAADEVLQPASLRDSMRDYAEQIMRVYSRPSVR